MRYAYLAIIAILAVAASLPSASLALGSGCLPIGLQDLSGPWEFLVKKYDKNGDGEIDRKEYGRSEGAFRNLDRNRDGVLKSEDLRPERRGDRRRPRGGESSSRQRARPLVSGDKAPDFRLPVLPKRPKTTDIGGENKVEVETASFSKADIRKLEYMKLSSFQGEKPVALIFGSYT